MARTLYLPRNKKRDFFCISQNMDSGPNNAISRGRSAVMRHVGRVTQVSDPRFRDLRKNNLYIIAN